MSLVELTPGLLAMIGLLVIGAVVFGSFFLMFSRSGTSLRPVYFVGGMYAFVLLPQFAFHLGVATGVVPRGKLTWMPAAEEARVYGWVEREAELAVRDGQFVDASAVFGPGVDAALAADLRVAGPATPFGTALAARMAIVPPDGSVIVARFDNAFAAEAAARAYAAQALGLWPTVGADGLRTARRPVGDLAKLVVAGRTVVVATGADESALGRRMLALGALRPGPERVDPAAASYWLYRPGVLPAIVLVLIALYVVVFFKGAAWAGSAPPAPGVAPVGEADMRQRLLAINGTGVPFEITPGADGRLVATWRFADARWLDHARAHRLSAVHRLLLEPDATVQVVRVTEQQTRFDADAGAGGAALKWETKLGFTFFEVQSGRVFGLQIDAHGRPLPDLQYAWRFDSRELKTPLEAAVTGAGWHWRPTPWLAPRGLRWLTD